MITGIFFVIAMIWMLGNLACIGLGAWLLWMMIQDRQYNRRQKAQAQQRSAVRQ